MMKDRTSRDPTHNLPRCPLTTQCVRLIDEIDMLAGQHEALDSRHWQRVHYLSGHLRTCATCLVAVAHTRRMRDQQRMALRDWLTEAEARVPTTTARIMTAIGREASSSSQAFPDVDVHSYNDFPAHMLNDPNTHHSHTGFPRIVAVAVAAVVIVASFALFGQLVGSHSLTANQRTSTPTPLVISNDWSSVIMIEHAANGGGQSIENYNPVTGKSLQLLPSCCSRSASIDGIAHQGNNLVYHDFDRQSNKTAYHLLTGQTYTIAARGSNAVWSTDDLFIFMATDRNVVQINVSNGRQTVLPFALHASSLAFYRDGFIFFTRVQNNALSDLWRVNLASGQQNQAIIGASSPLFWLDPTGAHIYYTRTSAAGQRDIYMVKNDGSVSASTDFSLRTNGTPVGYAADGSLMMIRDVRGNFQVIKLGATPQQDQVLMADVAPGAISLCPKANNGSTPTICDSYVALAPYGRVLVVQATFADGTNKVWSDDLTTGKQFVLQTRVGAPVNLLGWDRLVVK